MTGTHERLRNKLQRIALNLISQLCQSSIVKLTGTHTGFARFTVNRLDNQVFQVSEHILFVGGIATPPGLYRWQTQLAAQQSFRNLRQILKEHRVFDHPGTQRVSHHQITGAHHFQQTRNPKTGVCAQLNRITEPVIHTTQQHVDALQTIQGFHPQATIAHHQVVTLNQRKTQVIRHIGVFKIGFVVRTWGQQRHPCLSRIRRQTEQLSAQTLKESRQPVHMTVTEQTGENPRHNRTVFQRIASTGW